MISFTSHAFSCSPLMVPSYMCNSSAVLQQAQFEVGYLRSGKIGWSSMAGKAERAMETSTTTERRLNLSREVHMKSGDGERYDTNRQGMDNACNSCGQEAAVQLRSQPSKTHYPCRRSSIVIHILSSGSQKKCAASATLCARTKTAEPFICIVLRVSARDGALTDMGMLGTFRPPLPVSLFWL